MWKSFLIFLMMQLTALPGFAGMGEAFFPQPDTPLVVRICKDFRITGRGKNGQWKKAAWVGLQKLDTGGTTYKSRFKILYSVTGIYVLFDGADGRVSSSFKKAFPGRCI